MGFVKGAPKLMCLNISHAGSSAKRHRRSFYSLCCHYLATCDLFAVYSSLTVSPIRIMPISMTFSVGISRYQRSLCPLGVGRMLLTAEKSYLGRQIAGSLVGERQQHYFPRCLIISIVVEMSLASELVGIAEQAMLVRVSDHLIFERTCIHAYFI